MTIPLVVRPRPIWQLNMKSAECSLCSPVRTRAKSWESAPGNGACSSVYSRYDETKPATFDAGVTYHSHPSIVHLQNQGVRGHLDSALIVVTCLVPFLDHEVVYVSGRHDILLFNLFPNGDDREYTRTFFNFIMK